MKRLLLILLFAADLLSGESIRVPGLRKSVEILRDKWGVPHIYAANTHDLFFAQGYITAKDRLFQIDLWRRVGTGKLSEVLGPAMLERDKLARSVNFRGDWNREWTAYSPDAREIVSAFTGGINAYIHSLNGRRPKEFERAGFRKLSELPHDFNPARHFIATANNNIVPEGYSVPLGYDAWALPFRVDRIRQMLTAGKKFDISDFESMQQDVTSLPARRFQAVLRKWTPEGSQSAALVRRLIAWNAVLSVDSPDALLYEVWLSNLQTAVMRDNPDGRPNLELLLRKLEAGIDPLVLQQTLNASLAFIYQRFGVDETKWQWGALHKLTLHHPLAGAGFDLSPVARPGDANTVNATSGVKFQQSSGASWREILDVGKWDRSVITNVPGESGDPASKHYSDLLSNWAKGEYHPLPYSRKAVEAATEERIQLLP